MYILSSAQSTAELVLQHLAPHCDRIEVAGSVRRKVQEVKDLEIVCQPKKVFVKNPALLFDEGKWQVSEDFEFALDNISAAVEKGQVSGRYMKVILKNGMPMDLFMPQPADYFRQLVIRTGNSDYVHNVIAAQWKIKGWCGTENGLRLITECAPKTGTDGKTTWRCTTDHPTLPPVWESEKAFFYWLGLPFTPPECRHINNYVNYIR